MNKSIQLLAVAFCFALAAGSQAYAQIVVTNGGFENPIGSEWLWQTNSGTNASFYGQFGTTNVHSGASGTNVYKIAYGDAVGSGYAIQTISNLTAGAAYTVQGWVFLYFRADRNWAYIEADGGGAAVQSPPQGANPMLNNTTGIWTNVVVTQTARVDGTLDVLLYLNHYSGTVNGKDNGGYFDDIQVTLAPPPAARPQIISLSGAGTASVTVHYTNTLTGTNYTLIYKTNLNTTNWYPVGTATASGTSDSQTDNAAGGSERYYRVYYLAP